MGLGSQSRSLFIDHHFNCTQSVLGVFAERFGLPKQTAFRIATPFGGGMGHTGSICGAVSGALMVIGLARGTPTADKAIKDACYALAADFQARFQAKHGSLTCPHLLGVDIRDPIQLAQAREQHLFETRCSQFVEDAVLIVANLLDLHKGRD